MNKNKSDRRQWLLPLLAATGVIAFALLGSRFRVSYRTPLSGCVYDAGTGGASGLYQWCGRIGVPATLLEVPLWEAPQVLSADSGNVLLTMGDGPLSPSGVEGGAEEWRAIRAWLERGNALIVVTGSPGGAPSALLKELSAGAFQKIETDEPAGAPGPLSLPRAERVESRPETVDAPVTGSGSLTVEARGLRWKEPQPNADADPDGPAEKPDARTRSTATAGWRLAGDVRGGVLLRIPVGRGACYVLLDAFAWTNAGLDSGDNARVLAEILDNEVRGGSLAIDEYRHGHGRAESFLTYLLSLPGASAFLWLALAWALLFYYARNVRLRPAERHVEAERRTAQEYIDAVAQLHERARAAPLAVEAVAGRLRQLARASVERESAVASLLREADAYVEAGSRPARPDDAVRLVTQLVQLRKRFYGSRTVS